MSPLVALILFGKLGSVVEGHLQMLCAAAKEHPERGLSNSNSVRRTWLEVQSAPSTQASRLDFWPNVAAPFLMSDWWMACSRDRLSGCICVGTTIATLDSDCIRHNGGIE
jgi:hypothetical protein